MTHIFAAVTRRINYANVVATLALILAMTGGATAASKQVVIAAKKIGGRQIKSNSITTSKVKNYSLMAVDFAPGQIPAGPAGPPGSARAYGRVSSNGIVDSASSFNLSATHQTGTGTAGRYCVGVASGTTTTAFASPDYGLSPTWDTMQAYRGDPNNPVCPANMVAIATQSAVDQAFWVMVP